MKNDHEITERNLLPGLQLISFISIHVTLQIKYFMFGSQVRPLRQKGILVWAAEISSQLKHSSAGHKSYIAWLVSSLSQVCSTAALQHSAAGDRTVLSGTRDSRWPVVVAGPQCTSLPGHRHQSAPDFSLRKILIREFNSVPYSLYSFTELQ